MPIKDDNQSSIITSETIGHKIKSLEIKYTNIKRLHENRFKELDDEINDLIYLVNKERNEIEEIKLRKEQQLRDVELKISNDILELRSNRCESEISIENYIKNYISKLESQEFNTSSKIDTRREEQFTDISNSLNNLTEMVELLRKKRKNIQHVFNNKLQQDAEEIQETLKRESTKRENSIEGMKQLLEEILSHFQTEMSRSKINRLEVDRQILDQLEFACQDAENKLMKIVNFNEN